VIPPIFLVNLLGKSITHTILFLYTIQFISEIIKIETKKGNEYWFLSYTV